LSFLSAVFNSWFAYLGVATLVVPVIQHLSKGRFHPNPNIWKAVGVICLFAACYQAWLDQRASYFAERCKIERLQDRSAERKQLAALRNEGDDLFSALSKDSSEESVKAWFFKEQDWEGRLYKWTKENLGDGAAGKVMDKNGMPAGSWRIRFLQSTILSSVPLTRLR
jgi:hypothetical protein